MPLTFPSHAAAVLPFSRRGGWLPPAALVVGSTAPDLAYLFGLNHCNFHLWPGLVWPCLPIAFGVWLFFEWVLLPWVAVLVGETWGDQATVLARTRGTPTSLRGVTAAIIALAVGALTHVTWDGFTHAWRWPASATYGAVHVGRWLLTDVLQAGSHLLGLALVWRAARRLTPRARWSEPRVTARAWRFVLVLAGCELTALGLLAARGLPVTSTPAFSAAWETFWWSSRALLLAMTLCAVTERVRTIVSRLLFRAG